MITIPVQTSEIGQSPRPRKSSSMIQRRYLSTAEASAYTGIPAATLRKFRYECRGPVYSKPAGRALYDIADLDSFMASGRRVPSVRASKEMERHGAL